MSTSPTPWMVFRSPDGMDTLAVIMDANDGLVGETPCGDAQSMANAALIVEAVNAYEANKAHIAELEALLEECKPFVGDAHADHIEYMGGSVNYERDLSRLSSLLGRIDAALKGEG